MSEKLIELSDFRKLLGDFANELTDQQVEVLYDIEYKLADIFFDQKLRERNTGDKTND